jgi:hypothetical protein
MSPLAWYVASIWWASETLPCFISHYDDRYHVSQCTGESEWHVRPTLGDSGQNHRMGRIIPGPRICMRDAYRQLQFPGMYNPATTRTNQNRRKLGLTVSP